MLHGWFDALSLFASHSNDYIRLMKTTEAQGAPTSGTPRERGFIMNVARALNNWRQYRQTVSELGRMSNRELQDLGIDRADIRSVARAAIAR